MGLLLINPCSKILVSQCCKLVLSDPLHFVESLEIVTTEKKFDKLKVSLLNHVFR